MTGPQAVSAKPRLARKGLAVPVGPADQPGLAEPNGASSARPGAGSGSGAEMDREASTGTPAPIPDPGAARGREAATAPAASLLPSDFPGARGPSFDPAAAAGGARSHA